MTAAQLRAYARTPKALLLVVLLALAAIAYPVDGKAALVRLALSAGTAVAFELVLLRWRDRKVEMPDSALLTGLIAAMVTSQTAPWYVPVLVSALAISSKHLVRVKSGHIFNPAAVGLLATALVLSSEQSWWGGLGDLPAGFIVVVIALGLFVADRVNKLPSVLTFSGVYFGLLTVASIFGSPQAVADTFREPMTGAAMFFAFFMLTDPPTTPARARDQVWFALVVAVVSLLCVALSSHAIYYLLVGLLAGNAFEAVRRWTVGRARQARLAGPARLSPTPTQL